MNIYIYKYTHIIIPNKKILALKEEGVKRGIFCQVYNIIIKTKQKGARHFERWKIVLSQNSQ